MGASEDLSKSYIPGSSSLDLCESFICFLVVIVFLWIFNFDSWFPMQKSSLFFHTFPSKYFSTNHSQRTNRSNRSTSQPFNRSSHLFLPPTPPPWRPHRPVPKHSNSATADSPWTSVQIQARDCWWFRIPLPNHLGWSSNPVNNGKNYQPHLVSRISSKMFCLSPSFCFWAVTHHPP